MGAYPGADLTYGIDVGKWKWAEPEEGEEPELPWLTWELWKESWELETASLTYLESQGIKGVQLVDYGQSGHPLYALVTRHIECSGGDDVTTATPEVLRITDDDTRLLMAWDLLFPERRPGEPAWRLSATFD